MTGPNDAIVVAVRRCAEAPVIALFAGTTEREARRQAWTFCRNTRTHGFRIDLEEERLACA